MHINFRQIFRFNTSTKPTALFIEHSYRKKTRATQFLIDLLQKHFSLKYIFDENWKEGKDADVPIQQKFKYVFFCQVICPLSHLSQLVCKKTVVWFPMYDAVITGRNKQYLRELSKIPVKIVCFSKTLFLMLKKIGLKCFYVQYYPDPETFSPVTNYQSIRVYFWYRREPVNWEVVKTLLAQTNVVSITIKNDPDPEHKPLSISSQDVTKYRVSIYSKHLSVTNHEKIISQANIYIAPRVLEGIGMSFIEALTRGQCVIAPNQPTMNEYIRNNYNGYLYDVKGVKPLDLGGFARNGQNARQTAVEGHKKWLKESKNMTSFIKNS